MYLRLLLTRLQSSRMTMATQWKNGGSKNLIAYIDIKYTNVYTECLYICVL